MISIFSNTKVLFYGHTEIISYLATPHSRGKVFCELVYVSCCLSDVCTNQKKLKESIKLSTLHQK